MSQVIEWSNLCGEHSVFWDSEQVLNASVPVLPQCFQDTALVWLPCFTFLIILAFYLPYLYSWPFVNKWRDKGKVQWIKLVLLAVLCVLCIADLATMDVGSPPASYQKAALQLITFLLALYVTHAEFSRGFHTSGALFMLWLLLAVCGIFPFYTYILDTSLSGIQKKTSTMAIFYLYYTIVLVQFIMSCFSDLQAFQYERADEDEERKPLLGKQGDSKTIYPTKPPCPEKEASFINASLFLWITRLIWLGYRKTLVFDDLCDMMDRDKCAPVVKLATAEWERQTEGVQYKTVKVSEKDISKVSFIKCLLKSSEFVYYTSAIIRIIVGFLEYLNPILLNVVIAWVTSSDIYTWKGYTLAAILFFINIVIAITIHMYFKLTYVLGMRLRTAVITMIYRKALRLSHAARRNATVGEIVNLMSVDSQRIHDFVINIHEWWACPVLIAFCMYLLWGQVGPSSLAGLALMVVIAPINGGYVMAQFAKLQDLQMKSKDERIKVINEVLGGIKVLKMYAWEPSFRDKIGRIREKEVDCVERMAWLNGIVGITWFCTPYMVSLAIFATYVLSNPNNYLDPARAFVTITLVNFLNWFVGFIPVLISQGAQCYISVKRIRKFLLQEEVDPESVKYVTTGDTAVSIEKGDFKWDVASERNTLDGINMEVKEGTLVAVVGTVGCGKSSLLSAILGEMHKITGNVTVKGRIAYVSQQAWIQNLTVRDNILFGREYNEAQYNKVVEACALQPDFAILPGGDSTEIGEKGINLSGGQKQRVSLARAVYQNSDLYLLDDPLSAVDSHVGKHIFDKVLGPNGMLRNKTRILVTHGITYLPTVDLILTLAGGRVSEVGTYAQLTSTDGGAFAEFMRTYMAERSSDTDDPDLDEAAKRQLKTQISTLSHADQRSDTTTGSRSHVRSRKRTISRRLSRGSISKPDEVVMDRPKTNIIEEETAEIGKIKLGVLKNYIKSGGYWYLLLTVGMWTVYVGSQVATNIWLSEWSDDPYNNGTAGRQLTRVRLGVYGGIGVLQMASLFGLSMGIFLGGVVASKTMHFRLLDKILHAPMAFFDTTPLGRIVNRFSTDMDKLDNSIPLMTRWWSFNVSLCCSVMIVVCYSTPIFIAVLIPLIIVYYIVQKIYITSVRQMKRIESIRKSPIYTNFDETLVGVTCVRAYRRQEDFILKNDRLTDDAQTAWYPIVVGQRWLGILLDTLGALIVFFATVFAVISRDSITGGLVGLSISFAMQTTYSINMMVRGATELETNVVSLERIKEYTDIETEAEWENESTAPPESWPDKGEVEIADYSTRYRPGLDLVLRGMTLSIRQAEKVGIVGRTGAGKSSLALSLFRIIEAAGGKIVIDGRDISQLGLHDLRKKLTIIPQDPVIFSGTLRQNLDPFGIHSDEQLWASLELAHLKKFVSDLTEGLDYECGEGGEALSAGQRQLVCLARALLRKTQILLLDEATAAVDMETDELIQTTIRAAFRAHTVLTVAHRLNTILDYDRVVVLAGGEVKECDSPAALLENKASVFYGMAKDAGLA